MYEKLLERVTEFENKLKPFGVQKIQKVDFKMDALYKDRKWMMAVEDLEFVIFYSDGKKESIENFNLLNVDEDKIDEFEEICDGFTDDYYEIKDIIVEYINGLYSDEDIITLKNKQRLEETSVEF